MGVFLTTDYNSSGDLVLSGSRQAVELPISSPQIRAQSLHQGGAIALLIEPSSDVVCYAGKSIVPKSQCLASVRWWRRTPSFLLASCK